MHDAVNVHFDASGRKVGIGVNAVYVRMGAQRVRFQVLEGIWIFPTFSTKKLASNSKRDLSRRKFTVFNPEFFIYSIFSDGEKDYFTDCIINGSFCGNMSSKSKKKLNSMKNSDRVLKKKIKKCTFLFLNAFCDSEKCHFSRLAKRKLSVASLCTNTGTSRGTFSGLRKTLIFRNIVLMFLSFRLF